MAQKVQSGHAHFASPRCYIGLRYWLTVQKQTPATISDVQDSTLQIHAIPLLPHHIVVTVIAVVRPLDDTVGQLGEVVNQDLVDQTAIAEKASSLTTDTLKACDGRIGGKTNGRPKAVPTVPSTFFTWSPVPPIAAAIAPPLSPCLPMPRSLRLFVV